MSLPGATRARVLVTGLCAIVIAAALAEVGFFYTSKVLATRRAMTAEDSGATMQPATPTVQHPGANPVLVELFTSEGCSSCPPADALLAKLQQEQPVASANIIALEEHVDYWDHLGWRDRFSSPYITQRQQGYQSAFHLDDIYTPQFVVNGSAQFDGTNPSAIQSAIAQAATNTVPMQIAWVEVRYSNPITIRFMLAPSAAHFSTRTIDIYAAAVDSQGTTKVSSGENAGRTLSHVDAVVGLSRVGATDGRLVPHNRGFLELRVPVGQKLHKPRLVVFAQAGRNHGPVLGAAIHTIVEKDIVATSAHGPSDPDASFTGIDAGVGPRNP